MNSDDSDRRRIPAAVWWLTVAWLAVTAAAVVWAIPHEERNLTLRAQAAFAGHGVDVEFAGRDARLSGVVATQADLDRAVATVRQVRGVRNVEAAAVTVSGTATAPTSQLAPPELSIEFADGALLVGGTLPHRQAADAIVQAVKARFGNERVSDDVKVDPNTAGAAWLTGIVTAIDGLEELVEGVILVGPTGVVLTGIVASEATRTGLADTISLALGNDVPISNQLQVVPLTAPSFEAVLLEDGRIRLRGVMPDQATVDQIVAGAAGVFGSANVVNEMSVAATIAAPDYLRSLPATFGLIDGLQPWRVNVEDDAATISGQAVSEAALTDTLAALTSAYAFNGLTLSSELVVDPNAVASVLTELLQGVATFEVGSARLSAEAMTLLDEAIEILLANPTTVLAVEGHTDDVGSEEDNLGLSEARAQAVVDYLVAGGVDAARLTAVGYGESRPIADNATADGRAQNRRIEFVVIEGDS